jgi:2'-5' RNA ligase
MFKRIFFAISLPEKAKSEITFYEEEIKKSFDKGIKWVDTENLHITLSFLGAVRDEKIEKIVEEMEKIKMEKFSVLLNKISYFPPQKRVAKLILATGEGKDVYELQEKIEEKLVPSFKSKKESNFDLHLTLARIKTWEFSRIPTIEIPEINEDININFDVTHFDIIESKLKKEGPSYSIIKRINLI